MQNIIPDQDGHDRRHDRSLSCTLRRQPSILLICLLIVLAFLPTAPALPPEEVPQAAQTKPPIPTQLQALAQHPVSPREPIAWSSRQALTLEPTTSPIPSKPEELVVELPLESPSTSEEPIAVAMQPAQTTTPETMDLPSGPALLMDDWRFTAEQGLTTAAVQALLDGFPGSLKSATVTVGDRTQTAAEVLVGQASLYNLNPKVILSLLELRQGVLTQADAGDWYGSLQWIVRELYQAQRDVLAASSVLYFDGTWGPLPPDTNAASYAVLRVLAAVSTPDQLPALLGDGPGTFIGTYTQLFEDPRQPLGPVPTPAAPFLTYPKDIRSRPTSYFDHESPNLVQNGSVVTYWGKRDTRLSYDGHTGWDIGGAQGGSVLAAAAGTVMFAGNSDDGCGTPARAVILDHGNGYRTLYWHLRSIDVQTGQQVQQGDRLGLVGNSGCSSGPHLHFQTTFLGRNTDPYGWCGEIQNDPWANHPFGIRSQWLWLDKPSPCAVPEGGAMVIAGGEGFSTTGDWVATDDGLPSGALWSTSYEPPPPAVPEEEVAGSIMALSEQEPTLEPTPEPVAPPPPASATWSATIPREGRYRVMAQIPYLYNGREDATSVQYTIQSAEGAITVEVNQSILINDWADLGSYSFDLQVEARVTLTSNAPHDEGVWAGGVAWIPEGN